MAAARAAPRRWRVGVTLLPLIVWLGAACRQSPPPPASTPARATAPAASRGDRLTVLVSILPEAYFVERVGGERVQVQVLVGPGQNPHTYEPTPNQMSAMAQARVFFRIGLAFEEALLPKLRSVFRQLEIVDLRRGIALRRMEAHGRADDDDAHDHVGGGDDPHTWLDPKLVKIQAQTISDTLCRLDPAGAAEYRGNLAGFQADLDALDARLRQALAPLRGRELFVFHPAFGYFADAYGLRQVPVEIAGKEPAARDVAALIRRAREAGVRVIFVQPQFSTRSAEVIAEQIGGAVVPLDDLPRDYLDSLEAMAEQVRRALAPE